MFGIEFVNEAGVAPRPSSTPPSSGVGRKALFLLGMSVVLSVWSAAVVAQPKNVNEWLDRIAKSAKDLPYTGVYVHQTAEGSTTSRVTHLVDKQGNEHEKLEMLDGPLFEVVRRNEEMYCYRPDQKTVRIDRRATGRFFPSLVSGSPVNILDTYKVKLGQIERVAGHDCQWVILEPKDGMRYLQKLCAELGTGLLLRARLYNEKNQLLEQFMFTQIDVSGGVTRQDIRSRWEKSPGWQKDYSVRDSLKSADTGWQVGNPPAGFRKVMEMVRNLNGRKEPVAHLVYSDGLLNLSVFVEPSAGNSVQASAHSTEDGSISVAIRPLADFQVTVLGEVPVGAVQAIADSVSRRR
jgi:sigma-E factor negative regulatory protein RseB